MSKLKRVADTQGMPEYVENHFDPQFKPNDPYAHLRENAVQRHIKIANATMGEKEEIKENDWERIQTASVYNDPRFAPADDDLSNLQPQDVSGRGIRRAWNDTDENLNARDIQIQWGNRDDYVAAMLRGVTMFDDAEMISEELLKENNRRQAQFVSMQKREAMVAQRNANWEQEKLKTIRPKRIASSRAHEIIRTSEENLTDGRFGLPDLDVIEQRERERLSIIDRKREEKLALRREGKTPEQMREEWENQDLYANTYQDINADWLDRFLPKE